MHFARGIYLSSYLSKSRAKLVPLQDERARTRKEKQSRLVTRNDKRNNSNKTGLRVNPEVTPSLPKLRDQRRYLRSEFQCSHYHKTNNNRLKLASEPRFYRLQIAICVRNVQRGKRSRWPLAMRNLYSSLLLMRGINIGS